MTSDHGPAASGAYVTSITAGVSVQISEASTIDNGATVSFVDTSRALAITGLGEDGTTLGMGATVIDKDQSSR